MMRAFAYKCFLVSCTMALVLGVIAMLVDWERPDPELIDPSNLARIQIGEVVPPERAPERTGGKGQVPDAFSSRFVVRASIASS